jgi:hypothetical protein
VYRRADLSRTFVLVVALLLTADSTGVFAREFRPADPRNEKHLRDAFDPRRPGAEEDARERVRGVTGLSPTNVALIGTMTPVSIARLRGVERL